MLTTRQVDLYPVSLQVPGDPSSSIDCLQLSHNDLLVVQQGPSAPVAPASTPVAHASASEEVILPCIS